jgi:hypothetical protein
LLLLIDAIKLFKKHDTRDPQEVLAPELPAPVTFEPNKAYVRELIADDDVRYDAAGLDRMRALLDGADLVRPQNYFHPLPWHARWDTARTLLNRSLGGDYPGTFGVRLSTFRRMGGYTATCCSRTWN